MLYWSYQHRPPLSPPVVIARHHFNRKRNVRFRYERKECQSCVMREFSGLAP